MLGPPDGFPATIREISGLQESHDDAGADSTLWPTTKHDPTTLIRHGSLSYDNLAIALHLNSSLVLTPASCGTVYLRMDEQHEVVRGRSTRGENCHSYGC